MTPASMAPVRAGLPDLSGLVDLEQRCFSSDQITAAQFRYLLSRPTAEIWVLRDAAGKVVADLVLLYRKDTSAARIYSLAVDPEVRRQGLSRRLLAHGELAVRQRGGTELRLEVSDQNAAALRLYEALGFSPFGQKPGYYADGSNAIRLRKSV